MNRRPEWKAGSPREIVSRFCGLLAAELAHRRRRGLDDAYLALKYEGSLFRRNGRLLPLAVAAYAARLAPLVEAAVRSPGARFIDAGSGCGSESILLGLLGCRVSGLELVRVRREYARSRLAFYRDKLAPGGDVGFVNDNVLHFLAKDPGVDVIWANEAVSHIHPAETFFRAAWSALSPGGLLIVADSNGLNPIARWRAARIRGGSGWYTERRFSVLDDEAHDEVAEERLFSAVSLPRALRRAGFAVRRVEMFGFLGSSVLPAPLRDRAVLSSALVALQSGLKRLPGVRFLGSGMTIIAQK